MLFWEALRVISALRGLRHKTKTDKKTESIQGKPLNLAWNRRVGRKPQAKCGHSSQNEALGIKTSECSDWGIWASLISRVRVCSISLHLPNCECGLGWDYHWKDPQNVLIASIQNPSNGSRGGTAKVYNLGKTSCDKALKSSVKCKAEDLCLYYI